MSTTVPKFELKLNEESEINFKLTIEGTSSEGSVDTPEFRFIVTEMKGSTIGENKGSSGSGRGWLFPVKCEENDIVSVKITPHKEAFQTGKKYHGKLEVIVGSLLLVPTEVILEFTRPLQIEATPILSKKTTVSTVSQPTIKATVSSTTPVIMEDTQAEEALEEEINSVISPPPSRVSSKPSVATETNQDQHDRQSKSVQENIKSRPAADTALPVAKTAPRPQTAPVTPQKSLQQQQGGTLREQQERQQKIKKAAFKKQLQSLIRSALLEEENVALKNKKK